MSEKDEQEEPVTGIHSIPMNLRPWAESQARRTRELRRDVDKLNQHFEIGGMVYDLHGDSKFVRTLLGKVIPISLPVVLALLAGIWWLVQRAQPEPKAPPTAQEIAREIAKQKEIKP